MNKPRKHSSFYSKLSVLLVLFLMFTVTKVNGQVIEYTDSWGPSGMTLTRETSSGVDINFSINLLTLEDINIDGQPMKVPRLPEIFLPNNEGAPDLPGASKFIMIPQGARVELKILSSRSETISNVEIAPAPRIPWDNEDGPLYYKKNDEIYSKNGFYPEKPVIVSKPTKIRGVDVVMLGITPFQYNPVTKELTIYRDLKVQLTFVGGNGRFGEDRLRSRWWDPIIQDAIFNSSYLPQIDYSKRTLNSEEVGCEYLIIRPTGSDFAQWADSIKAFRTLQGILTKIVTITEVGGNNATTVENYINNAYNTWTIAPTAVLMLGDYGTSTTNNLIAPIYNNYCASDNILADVTGNHMPDIIFARMTANNATELQTMVTKFINYERTPPTNPNFYAHPITALGWQTTRWFQICSETVGGYWKNHLGKFPVRINAIYSGNPSSDPWSTATNTSTVLGVFGPTGLNYIPATPGGLGGWSGGNATMVNNAINSGAFILQHRDHGGVTGWGEPAYSNSNINGLTNTDLVFVNSINCLTGKYNNSSECFTEKFHRYTYNGQNSGALGLIAASEVSYSFVNDTYVWGMMDNMWPNFLPTYGTTPPSRGMLPGFGNAAGKIFLQASSWPYNTSNKEVTYHLFHLHGDAFMQLYSQVPQNLTVSHNPVVYTGATSFAVTANAGSFIALTLNGEILGTAVGTGSPVNITIPGTQLPPNYIHVTVTKENYYRYNADVQVIPPSGPYVICENVTISDPSPGGNGNGLMDYGETNKLNLTVKNVGVTQANGVNVKVSTTDQYITMTDSLENYGNIPAGQTKLVNQGFTYNVAANIPDGHIVPFTVTATGTGEITWESYFSLEAHAPIMGYDSYTITDSLGNNNGRLDPGETVTLYAKITNTGSSNAAGVSGILSSGDTYITVNVDSMYYGNINGGSSAIKNFTVTAAANTPPEHVANFNFRTRYNPGMSTLDTFSVVVGLIPNVVIGTGSSSCSYPYYTYYEDSKTDMIYTASEIIAAGGGPGYIVRIGFDVISPASQTMNGFMIKMQHTSSSSLSGFVSSGWTTVYTGTYAVPGSNWQDIQLTTPFQWNGTSNLLIEICFDNNDWTSNSTVKGTSASGKTWHRHVDNQAGCSLTGGYSQTNRPNIRLALDIMSGITNQNTGIPNTYYLSQNYPNPFNPTTKIEYAVPKQGFVSLKIYDLLGREVANLVNGDMEAGYYLIDFNGSHLASGVYFYRLEAGAFVETKRMVLIK